MSQGADGIVAVIEAGGTKFDCALVTADRKVIAETRIVTTTPDRTLGEVIDFFQQQRSLGRGFKKLGLACFGPLNLSPGSPSYGDITATPKPHWSQTPIKAVLEKALNCEVAIDTDVNCAALAEYLWGNGRGADVCIYITVGTGIGGGVMVHGKPLHGLIHPEIGHMMLPQFEGVQGVCPFHGNCLEGLASGTALAKIWHCPPQELESAHPAWDVEVSVLATMCHNLLVSFSPNCIILGGSVIEHQPILPRIIDKTEAMLNGYLTMPDQRRLTEVIVPTGLGHQSGLWGALALVL